MEMKKWEMGSSKRTAERLVFCSFRNKNILYIVLDNAIEVNGWTILDDWNVRKIGECLPNVHAMWPKIHVYEWMFCDLWAESGPVRFIPFCFRKN
jgi:hypothetical protein